MGSLPAAALAVVLIILALLIGPLVPAGEQLLYITQPGEDNRTRLYIHDLRHDIRHVLRRDLIGWGLDATWSPDGRSIVYSTFQPDRVRRDLYIIDLPENQPWRISREDLLDHNSPSWSPDGCCLVYQAVASGSDWDIYLHDLHSDERQLLFASEGIDGMPVWSPDGSRIAFVSFDAQAGAYAVFLLELADYALEVLLPLPDSGHYIMLDWSPDGESLVVAASSAVSSYRLYRLDAASGEINPLPMPAAAYSPAVEPAWSPDGTRIAFTASLPPVGSLHISLLDLRSDTMWLISGGSEGVRQPAWRPAAR